MSEARATLRAGEEQFRKMIDEMALDGETEHDDLYLNVLQDEVRILQSAPGEVVLTYGTYTDDYFDEIDLHVDISEETGTDKTGEEFTYAVGAEAILNVEEILTYLGFASDGGTVEVDLMGQDNGRLCDEFRAEGALETWVKLPGAQDVLDDVPQWLPFRFTDDDVFTAPNGAEAPTRITTKSSKLDTIVGAVEEDRDAEFYPIVVKDEEMYIDIGDESRSGISGTVNTQNVEGPDVENYYFDGFEEIIDVISGSVELHTGPGGNPVSFVQSSDGRVVRHVNGTVNS